MQAVTLFWRPMCGYCTTLSRALERRGIPFESINIWTDRSQAQVVRDANGGDEVVPTVRVGGTFLVNPSLEEVLGTLDAHRS